MMRASFLRFSPLLVLAAALVALAAFFVAHDAKPAAADHEDSVAGTVYSVTLTVADLGSGNFGCSVASSDCDADRITRSDGRTSGLTNFSSGGVAYNIQAITVNSGTLRLTLSTAATTLKSSSRLNLSVDGTDFALYASSLNNRFISNDTINWTNTGLTWAAGDTVTLKLYEPPPPPTGVEVTHTVWSATLTVPDTSTFAGCTALVPATHACSLTSVLSDDDFTYGGVDYSITELGNFTGATTIDMGISNRIPAAILSHGTLYVDGTPVSFADANSLSGNPTSRASWAFTTGWSTGDTVQLSLTVPTLPVAEGSSGTFTVALTDDPGASTTVHLVRAGYSQSNVGGSGYDWDASAATFSPETLTFTSSDYSTPQTVTVTAPEDLDDRDEQLNIVLLTTVRKFVYTYVGAGNGNYNLTNTGYVWAGNGMGSYSGSYQNVPAAPVGDSGNMVNGIHVTVADNDENAVVPTNLQALVGRTGLRDHLWLIRFSYDAPSGQTVTGYDLQWKREGTYWPAVPTAISGTSVIYRPGFTGTGHRIEWRVRARTSLGATDWATGTTVPLSGPTNMVSALSATAANGALEVNWVAPASWPFTGYEVWYKESGASDQNSSGGDGRRFGSPHPSRGWVDAGHTGTTTSIRIGNLDNGTTYNVRVRPESIWNYSWTFADGTPSGSSAPATQNPTAVTLSLDPATVSEGAGDVTLTASLDAPAPDGGITLRLNPGPDDTATRDTDYTMPDSVAIPAGQRSGSATITIANDGAAEGEETANITAFYSGIDGNLMGSAVLTITDPCDNCATGGEVGVVQRPPENKYADLIAKIKGWRDDPCCAHLKAHTDRWDRVLLPFGETVSDTTLSPMTAAEAQTYADRGWTRWVEVVKALRELENTAPTVSSAIADATIVNESGTLEVSLSGVFSDADHDALIITATSSDNAVATVSVAVDQSSLTVTAYSRGSAAITVTADDGKGGTVSDEFTVKVKAAPTVTTAIGDVTGLEAGATQDVSLSGVFGDADGDTLTITANSSNNAIATATVAADQAKLTVAGVAQGAATITVTAQDSDGNTVSDAFDVSVAAPQQQQQPGTPNNAPTVASAIGDATIINESGTQTVSLSGVFSDADNDSLTVTAASSAETVATVSVAADYATLTVNAQARGTATITVTANDGNGGMVSDAFTVRVKAAPTVASAISDVAGLEVLAVREISLSGVFSDADGDSLTLSAASSDTTVVEATLFDEELTIFSMAEGSATITVTAEDSDGNTVSDEFDVTVVGPPSVVANLSCIAETERVAFLWEEPEWSGGDVYVYDYELTLPDGRSEGGRLKGITLLLRPGNYQAGNEASVSITTVYELADGSNVSSAEETLTCTVK